MVKLRRTGRMGMSEEARSIRRSSIGGSDARIIMSGDQDAIEHLWRQKRGEIPPDDLSDVLIVQMGVVLEPLVLDWFEKETGLFVTGEQRRCVHPEHDWVTCTLDGEVAQSEAHDPHAALEAKFMFPVRWSLDEAINKYIAQFNWNAMVSGHPTIWFPCITGMAVFSHVEIEADPLYQACMLSVCGDFWDCVRTGRVPGNPVIEAPPVEAVRVVSMQGVNAWADAAATLFETTDACDRYEEAKKTIKKAMPDDAKEASGHGVRITRAKNGRMTVYLDEAVLAETRQRMALLDAVA